LPGLVDNERGTNLIKRSAKKLGISEKEAEQQFLRFISLRTRVTPIEIANAALFLASPDATKVTGQLFAVDGHCEWEE